MAEQTTAAEQHVTSTHRIVVGVDGSAASIEALHWAARIGTAIGVQIDAVAAFDCPTSYFGYSATAGALDADHDVAQVLHDAVTKAYGDTKPDGLRMLVRAGHSPSKVLLDVSGDAEMLVVGGRGHGHGHGHFMGLPLGSVALACAEHAVCPVVVVHAGHSPRQG